MTAARSPVDAVVIGAGIVGAACAEALARDGRRVLVLEQGVQGGGATGAAMGHLVAMDDSPAQLALTAYSLRLWRDVRDALPRDVERLDCGTLWLAEREDELATARAKRSVYAAAGVRAEVLDGDALASAEPELREGLAGALLVPDDCVVYPPAAARWLLREASALGAEVREGVAARAVRPNTVDTTEGPVRCDTVVVAAGCGARSLVPELPVVPKKGHLVVTDRYPGLCRHQLVELGYLASAHASEGPSVAFNLQPRPTGQLIIGSSRQFAGLDADIDRGIVGAMIARAIDFVPSLASVHALRVWTGFRPATADSLPLIGAWPAWDGMWIAAGHEGLGITTALGTAHLLADLIAGRATDIDPTPYAPDRIIAPAHA